MHCYCQGSEKVIKFKGISLHTVTVWAEKDWGGGGGGGVIKLELSLVMVCLLYYNTINYYFFHLLPYFTRELSIIMS